MCADTIKLDLRRDIGFLIEGIDDPRLKQGALDYLQTVVIDLEKGVEFADLDGFVAALELPTLDYAWDSTSWSVFSPSSGLLQRARTFFATVKEAYLVNNGDVCYEIAEPTLWGQGASQILMMDFVNGADAIYRSIMEYPVEGGVTISEDAYKRAAQVVKDIPLHLLAQEDRGAKEYFLSRFLEKPRPGADWDKLWRLYSPISTDAVFDAVDFDYGGLFEGIPDSDVMEIIRQAYQSVARVSVCRKKIADYVADTGKLHAKYLAHKKFIDDYVTAANGFTHVSSDMVLATLLIESSGIRTSKNGSHYGLMQITPEVFAEHRDESLASDILEYRANIAAGAHYLEWCFEHYNSPKSPAVAIGNYNWGIGSMSEYRLRKGEVNLKEVREETFNYLVDFLILRRMLASV